LLDAFDTQAADAQAPPAKLLVAGVPGRRLLLRLERAAGRPADIILDWSAVARRPASPLLRAVLSVPGTARHGRLSRWILDVALWRMDRQDGAVRAALLGAEDRAAATLAFAGGDQE
jgi:hypothetical protein